MRADLAKLRALHEAATPGPWSVCNRGCYSLTDNRDEADVDGPHGEEIPGAEMVSPIADAFTMRGQMFEPDAALIAAMHEALPELLAIAEAVERAPVVTIWRADVDAWNLPDSWSGQRARLLAIGEDG